MGFEQKTIRDSISIHAPAGGATPPVRRPPGLVPNFNSRPCGRGDACALTQQPAVVISIHAPAGGATWS